MTRGKRICNELRGLRRKIAEENGIRLEQPECTHKGDCRGTCPRCESELQYLEQALSHRISLGRAATVAGLSLTLTACGGVSTNDSNQSENTTPYERWQDDMEGFEDEQRADQDTVIKKTEGDDTGNCEEIATKGLILIDDDYYYDVNDKSSSEELEPILAGDLCDNPDIANVVKVNATDEEEIHVFVEKYPEFPGGEDALLDYLKRNIVYPKNALDNHITGTVVVKFVIEKDGSLSKVAVLRDIGGGCGEEAKRIVNNMPRWKPGLKNGKPVRVEFTIPVQFQIK